MTVIYNMSIDRADKPWIGDRRLTEFPCAGRSMRRSKFDFMRSFEPTDSTRVPDSRCWRSVHRGWGWFRPSRR